MAMDKPSIPEDLRRFVLTSIPSVPFLEALLLMRADPDHAWRRDTLARRLYVREKTAEDLLADLCTARIAVPCQDGGAYRYAPIEAGMRERIDRLADVYAKNLVEVTALIHSNTTTIVQRFADAFKWRKDE